MLRLYYQSRVLNKCYLSGLDTAYVRCSRNYEKLYKGRVGVQRPTSVLIQPGKFGRVTGLPLSPAHSLTIHKSQSLLIPYCKIDTLDPFACGQLYATFSRAPSHKRIMLLKKVTLRDLNRFRKEVNRIQLQLTKIQETSSSFQIFEQFALYCQATMEIQAFAEV